MLSTVLPFSNILYHIGFLPCHLRHVFVNVSECTLSDAHLLELENKFLNTCGCAIQPMVVFFDLVYAASRLNVHKVV